MLVGDPNRFAIWFDPVETWSTERFQNGSFAYFVGGRLLWSLKSTIGVDLHMLEGLECMDKSTENSRLFDLPTAKAYQEMCALAYPSMDSDVEDSDYTYVVSPQSLSDEGYCIFLIESNEKAKLIHGVDADLSSVQEFHLELGEFQRVVAAAIRIYRQGKSTLK